MKLIVGLGNPGREYKNTRHNIGFIVVDEYLGKVDWKTKLESDIYKTDINGEEVIFIKPQTYMNLSGMAVAKVSKYYKIDSKDILVIQDDLDMAFGKFKLKRNSSSGGHNGIKSIISELGNDEFARLKIGIGKDLLIPVDKYVLSKLSENEINSINDNMNVYKDIINIFIKDGIEKAMLSYNNR